MKNFVFLQLSCITLLGLLILANAWPWPEVISPLEVILARQDMNNNDNINGDNNKPDANAPPAPPVSQETAKNTGNQIQTSSATETSSGGLVTGLPKETKSGDKSESKTATKSKSFNAQLPAGGITMMTPAVSLGQQYFKIGDYVTFGWNYTSLEATPTAVNIMATCTANKQLYTIEMNQTVASNTGLVIWDTGKYQATAVQNPLLTQTYTLIIYDSDSSISATAQPGYLAVFNQYTFGMYSPQPYTPLGDFRCATCNSGLSAIEKNALSMAFGMSMITILSFTYFVKRTGVIW